MHLLHWRDARLFLEMQSFSRAVELVRRHSSGIIRTFKSESLQDILGIHYHAIARCSLQNIDSECKKRSMIGSIPHTWITRRGLCSEVNPIESVSQDATLPFVPRIKFKRLDKMARNIMQIVDKEAVEEVRAHREIPDVKPGYIIQLKVESPDNKRRVSLVKGIVIARRNAGLNSTFRLRRMVAGVGVESLYMLYSPNIKEIKVLERRRVRRAKLYYLRDRMNALKKQ